MGQNRSKKLHNHFKKKLNFAKVMYLVHIIFSTYEYMIFKSLINQYIAINIELYVNQYKPHKR